MLNQEIFYKIILFWFIFYITPGPVWVAIMESAKDKGLKGIFHLFFKTFLPANIIIQCSQALLIIVFIKNIADFIRGLEFVFYLLGSLYILYMAINVLRSKLTHSSFQLNFTGLVVILLLSPKIWTLFPVGAVLATSLTESFITNALVFVGVMFITSTILYFFYAFLGVVAYQILKDKFSYISFGLLLMFAVFLFYEFIQLILSR